jgi:hypothetical protein
MYVLGVHILEHGEERFPEMTVDSLIETTMIFFFIFYKSVTISRLLNSGLAVYRANEEDDRNTWSHYFSPFCDSEYYLSR